MKSTAQQGSSQLQWLLVAAVIIAAVLRFFHLSEWSFNGDEMNTLRDSIQSSGLRSPKPLLFLLNHYLVAPLLPLDEFGLRLLPAVFGVLAVPAMFWTVRSLFGARTGLIAATLVVFNPWHLYWSQFARYYSLVFLLCAIFPILLYRGGVERQVRLAVAGAMLAVLAILAHPSAALVLAGNTVWFVLSPGRLSTMLPRQRGARAALLAVGLVVTVVIMYRITATLVDWFSTDYDWGFAGSTLLLSYVGWLVPALVVFSAAGIAWTWMEDERLATYLTLAIGIPLGLLALISLAAPVSTAYLFATAPLIILTAGRFIDRLGELGRTPAQRGLIVATCLAAMLAAGAPRFVSHYIDGTRFDVRAAARQLDQHASDDAIILADQDEALGHYLAPHPVLLFPRNPDRATSRIKALDRAPEAWLVVSVQRRGGLHDQDLGAAGGWVREHCELNATFGRSRLDHKHNELQVFRCSFTPNRVRAGSRP